MNALEALALIQTAAHWHFWPHYFDRLGRGYSRADVRYAVANATGCEAGNVDGRWVVTGPTCRGRVFRVVVIPTATLSGTLLEVVTVTHAT